MPELISAARGGVFNIMRFSTHDGPGIRTTVFFKGCPLSCWWCHNPESQRFQPDVLYFEERCRHCGDCLATCPEGVTDFGCRRCSVCAEACQSEARQVAGKRMTADEVVREVERDLIFFEESGGGVTLSGGEPVAQPRFAEAVLRACRERRIHAVLETCGFAHPEVFLRVALAADLVLFDLKLMDPVRHKRYTGVSNRGILRNLEQLVERGRAVRVRIPVVPGINDSEEDAADFAEYLKRLAIRDVELLPYHHIGIEKYRRLGLSYKLAETPRVVVGGSR
jgi:pyruvate formate lyase activating enzyme